MGSLLAFLADQSSVVLMCLAILIHALLMFISLAASVYVMKILNAPNLSSNRASVFVHFIEALANRISNRDLHWSSIIATPWK